jgi:hypothetical protein
MASGTQPDSKFIDKVSDSFIREADALIYASGDHVANDTTPAAVTAANSAFILLSAIRSGPRGAKILRAILKSDAADFVNADFRIHFFNIDPYGVAPTSGDNDAISLDVTAGAGYLGFIDVSLDSTVIESTALGMGIPAVPLPIKGAGAGTTLWGVLEARGAYTPSSGEVFTLNAMIEQA